MKTPLLPLFALALAVLAPPTDVQGAPANRTSQPSAHTFKGRPSTPRGSMTVGDDAIASGIDRAKAISTLLGINPTLSMVWASVTVRRPNSIDRAALVFTDPQVVDARRGVASWSASAAGFPADDGQPWTPPIFSLCDLFGCPGGEEAGGAKGMQLWVNANASKRYYAECRVRLAGKKGEVKVTSDGNFATTFTIDHSGKSFARIGFVVDPEATGWYGFAISSATAWSSYGCTLDELE